MLLITLLLIAPIGSSIGKQRYPCGVPLKKARNKGETYNRIRGGLDVEPHSIPWQVLVKSIDPNRTNPFFCGGSLINSGRSNDSDLVITAAHCLELDEDKAIFAEPKNIHVFVGAHDFTQEESSRRRIDVSSFVVHKSYRTYMVENDIALIRLKDAIPFTDETRPICLPKRNEPIPYGVNCVISGWGQMSEHGIQSPILKKNVVQIIHKDKCNYSHNPRMHLCTKGEGDICNGDSGGPLACPVKGKYVLLGIASYGDDKCTNSIFASVRNYITWYKKEKKKMFPSKTGIKKEISKLTHWLGKKIHSVQDRIKSHN